ncbi:hypothetical protein FSPOR_6469 [Fusarium sporotrichioides]|uniref:Uncharacterized protein n=1 Tax=Fusarium sporotrichioides TaxID=5514 RepID=A0A395S3U2_FUSSP|nr:hypothetical protein FSPOR_6469 [Fusarium sporotrichioides]
MADSAPTNNEATIPQKCTHDDFTQKLQMTKAGNQHWNDAEQAEVHYQRAALHLATLRGEHRHAKKARNNKDAYIQKPQDDVDVQFADDETTTDRNASRRRSGLLNDMKREILDRINQTEAHCDNALPDDACLAQKLQKARAADDEIRTRLNAAKGRLVAICHMWEVKLDRQTAAKAQRDHEKLESQIRDLEMQRDVLAESHRAMTDKVAMSSMKAQAGNWTGILDSLASPAL